MSRAGSSLSQRSPGSAVLGVTPRVLPGALRRLKRAGGGAVVGEAGGSAPAPGAGSRPPGCALRRSVLVGGWRGGDSWVHSKGPEAHSPDLGAASRGASLCPPLPARRRALRLTDQSRRRRGPLRRAGRPGHKAGLGDGSAREGAEPSPTSKPPSGPGERVSWAWRGHGLKPRSPHRSAPQALRGDPDSGRRDPRASARPEPRAEPPRPGPGCPR